MDESRATGEHVRRQLMQQDIRDLVAQKCTGAQRELGRNAGSGERVQHRTHRQRYKIGGRPIRGDRLVDQQAPADVESGYKSFLAYYRANYSRHLPADRAARILVISCGPGYLVNMLAQAGYTNVHGIDSDAGKVAHAKRHGLPCEVADAFEFLGRSAESWDTIIPEQELNHLTLDEMIDFLALCRRNLKPGGLIIVYGLNGANPLVGSENLAHNSGGRYDIMNTTTGLPDKMKALGEQLALDHRKMASWYELDIQTEKTA